LARLLLKAAQEQLNTLRFTPDRPQVQQPS
jgi:hypothetical protein